LATLEQRIQHKLEPYAAQVALLQEIPGVDWTLAAVIIAELGIDMSVFQSVSQLSSWAGVCPGNNESAGKRKSSRIPKGNIYLKTALVEAANAAARTKGTYLRDKFYRLKARRGYKRAVVAIAHKI
jgi:transposase